MDIGPVIMSNVGYIERLLVGLYVAVGRSVEKHRYTERSVVQNVHNTVAAAY